MYIQSARSAQFEKAGGDMASSVMRMMTSPAEMASKMAQTGGQVFGGAAGGMADAGLGMVGAGMNSMGGLMVKFKRKFFNCSKSFI